MTTVTDERVVIESYSLDNGKDYVDATVCRDMDEAVELIEQARVRRPFLRHVLRRLAAPVPSPNDPVPADPVKVPGPENPDGDED